MENTKFTKRIDDLGRIHIPKDIRKELFGDTDTSGIEMNVVLQKDSIILQKIENHDVPKDSNDDDEICTWKKMNHSYRTGCDGGVASLMRGYNYCPYCGKRLKLEQ